MTMTEKIMDSCGVRSSKTDRVAISVTTTTAADAVVVVGVSAVVGRVVARSSVSSTDRVVAISALNNNSWSRSH